MTAPRLIVGRGPEYRKPDQGFTAAHRAAVAGLVVGDVVDVLTDSGEIVRTTVRHATTEGTSRGRSGRGWWRAPSTR